MQISWLGHSGFKIEIEDQVLLVDPWMTGNPMFPAERRAEVLRGVTHILVSHGHGDHVGDTLAISQETGAPVVGIFDLISWWKKHKGIDGIGFNKGGTIQLGRVAVTMVNASHSSTLASDGGPVPVGSEAGFMIAGEGHTIYFSGDTDVMADMEIFNDLHAPDIGILCAGGHFTMDMRRVAYAAKRFFNFKTLIPCHYRTFPILEQSAEKLIAELPDVQVIEPEVLQTIKI
ncbi:MAG TPA: metal-dependent hydrolase [Paracoccaceae bacterium]|nr:metal-dependent hydrolase [Paracoccaceae bacterium]